MLPSGFEFRRSSARAISGITGSSVVDSIRWRRLVSKVGSPYLSMGFPHIAVASIKLQRYFMEPDGYTVINAKLIFLMRFFQFASPYNQSACIMCDIGHSIDF